jgi:hypothetical protein
MSPKQFWILWSLSLIAILAFVWWSALLGIDVAMQAKP